MDAALRGRGPLSMRYRDFGQDRRIQLAGIPVCIGEVGWRVVLARHDMVQRLAADGAATVISRLSLRAAPGPVTIASRLEADVVVGPAHDETGRVYLNMWARLEDAKTGIAAGTMFAEHVITRFHGERLVTAIEGLDTSARWVRQPALALLDAPTDWTPVGDAGVDPNEVVFGLDHTDGNRHVNTLVFPRLAVDAGHRLLADHGPLRAEGIEIGYRKPCFAGERMRIALRPYRTPTGFGVLAHLTDGSPRPHVTTRIQFSR